MGHVGWIIHEGRGGETTGRVQDVRRGGSDEMGYPRRWRWDSCHHDLMLHGASSSVW